MMNEYNQVAMNDIYRVSESEPGDELFTNPEVHAYMEINKSK